MFLQIPGEAVKMKKLTRLLFFIALPIETIFCFGCSSIGGKSVESTASPEFDISNYHKVYINYGDDASFLNVDINEVFGNCGFDRLNNAEYFKSHDLYVIVTVYKGFTLPPTPTRNLESIYVQPKTAKVEIQDAITKKQLLLCVYRRGFFGTASYGECREMLVKELTRVLNELKAKSKKPAPQPAPDEKK